MESILSALCRSLVQRLHKAAKRVALKAAGACSRCGSCQCSAPEFHPRQSRHRWPKQHTEGCSSDSCCDGHAAEGAGLLQMWQNRWGYLQLVQGGLLCAQDIKAAKARLCLKAQLERVRHRRTLGQGLHGAPQRADSPDS